MLLDQKIIESLLLIDGGAWRQLGLSGFKAKSEGFWASRRN